MKKFLQIVLMVTALYLFLLSVACAQPAIIPKNDRIFFLNGDVKDGRVTALTNDKVKFIHSNETLDYEFSKKEIDHIEFASGRKENISAKKTIKPVNTVSTRNRVAVIPVRYVADGSNDRSDYMRTHLQEIAISFLGKSAVELKYLDAAEINAALLNNEISEDNISQYSPKELAELLQVEYVIMGSVMQDKGKVVTVVNGNANTKQTINRNSNDVRIKGKSNVHGTEVTTQDIETQVTLTIYNETGQKIYDQSRHSLLTDADAYKNTIRYLLKRTPLYKR